MIQIEELTGLMKGTIPFTDASLSGLSDMVAKYPYFQAAHLLHTLNLLQLKDTRFIYDLRKTAIYIPDRKQLFFLVESDFLKHNLMEDKPYPDNSSMKEMETNIPESIEKGGKSIIDSIATPTAVSDYVSYFLSDMEQKETPPLQHQDIIDKFLEKDAVSPLKIKLIRTDEPAEELPEPIPEPPVSDSFFSETLAKIFIKQKKYDKALGIIRKLNLIYPEKSRYFADRIRFLEQLIILTNKNK